ncbi:hypothetical protein REPUB_Repub10bG0180000 [Reevesia pubescens]
MAFAHYLVAVPIDTSKHTKTSILTSSSSTESLSSLAFTSSSLFKARNLSIFPRMNRIRHKAKAEPQESEVNMAAADAFTHFKHLLLPITDSNPYLSDGTRQAAATTAALAMKYGADVTVVVIDEKQKEALPEHETQLASVRWHLSEGMYYSMGLESAT